jgi:hypothetical protein
VSTLMEAGILKHPLTSVGMPVLHTVKGIKYGTAVRRKAATPDEAAKYSNGRTDSYDQREE